MVHQHRKGSITLEWVPDARLEHRWQLRVLRNFDRPKTLSAASAAWEALAPITELLECHVPDPENPDTWDVVLALTHQSVWTCRQKKGTLRRIMNVLRTYVTLPSELTTQIKEWWGKKPKRVVQRARPPWEIMFALYCEFKRERGREPRFNEIYRGGRLGTWCNNERQLRNQKRLSADRIRRLAKEGFSWNTRDDQWEEMFSLYCAFKRQYKREPESLEVYCGKRLERWCAKQRHLHKQKRLSSDRIHRLTKAGFPWNTRDDQWEEMFSLYCAFKRQYKRELGRYEIYRGKNLGEWCSTQRRFHKQKTLSAERNRRLTKAGFLWDPLDERWVMYFSLYCEFKRQYKREPMSTEIYSRSRLGRWCAVQRHHRKQKRLSSDRIHRLTKAGFPWRLR